MYINICPWKKYNKLVSKEREKLILEEQLFNNLHCVLWIGNGVSNSSRIVEYFIIISTLSHIFVKSNKVGKSENRPCGFYHQKSESLRNVHPPKFPMRTSCPSPRERRQLKLDHQSNMSGHNQGTSVEEPLRAQFDNPFSTKGVSHMNWNNDNWSNRVKSLKVKPLLDSNNCQQ